ncbi:MAG: hypothetical protein ABIU63_10745 [Chitinophagaceae bacterium]
MKSSFFFLLIAALLLFFPATAQLPTLNSFTAANATVFIDFDGHYVSGTAWNMDGPINAAPAGYDAGVINEIFSRVAEDFRPFNLNITTDSTQYWLAPKNKRMRIIVTPTSQ